MVRQLVGLRAELLAGQTAEMLVALKAVPMDKRKVDHSVDRMVGTLVGKMVERRAGLSVELTGPHLAGKLVGSRVELWVAVMVVVKVGQRAEMKVALMVES